MLQLHVMKNLIRENCKFVRLREFNWIDLYNYFIIKVKKNPISAPVFSPLYLMKNMYETLIVYCLHLLPLEFKKFTKTVIAHVNIFQDESLNESEDYENNKEINEKADELCDNVDSKTLKYQFQSAQNELKRKIEILESVAHDNKLKVLELLKILDEEKEISQRRLEDNEKLKEELILMEQKLKESSQENQHHKDKIEYLGNELEVVQNKFKSTSVDSAKEEFQISNEVVSHDQLLCLEEELVLLKERFAQVSEEKIKLVKDLITLREQYNLVCNRSHNKYFFYVAPLIAMVLYLLVSAMIS